MCCLSGRLSLVLCRIILAILCLLNWIEFEYNVRPHLMAWNSIQHFEAIAQAWLGVYCWVGEATRLSALCRRLESTKTTRDFPTASSDRVVRFRSGRSWSCCYSWMVVRWRRPRSFARLTHCALVTAISLWVFSLLYRQRLSPCLTMSRRLKSLHYHRLLTRPMTVCVISCGWLWSWEIRFIPFRQVNVTKLIYQ